MLIAMTSNINNVLYITNKSQRIVDWSFHQYVNIFPKEERGDGREVEGGGQPKLSVLSYSLICEIC